MPKTLVLIRHAKSDWSLDLPDHARTLNPRGKASTPKIGAWLRSLGCLPDEILSSSAERTKETCALLGFPECPPLFRDTLYLAPAAKMLTELKRATGDCVFMIGHNPGIADFAHQLVSAAPDHPRFRDYPTCATTVIDFDILDWGALTLHSGTARAFTIPRELD